MLKAYLADLARTPFAWGQADCATAIADWWRLNTGIDPAGALRASYASEADAEQVFFRDGCLPRLVSRLARSVNARQTHQPKPGDIAVIRFDAFWACAIMTPAGRWAVKRNDGLAVVHPRDVKRVVTAWSFAAE